MKSRMSLLQLKSEKFIYIAHKLCQFNNVVLNSRGEIPRELLDRTLRVMVLGFWWRTLHRWTVGLNSSVNLLLIMLGISRHSCWKKTEDFEVQSQREPSRRKRLEADDKSSEAMSSRGNIGQANYAGLIGITKSVARGVRTCHAIRNQIWLQSCKLLSEWQRLSQAKII